MKQVKSIAKGELFAIQIICSSFLEEKANKKVIWALLTNLYIPTGVLFTCIVVQQCSTFARQAEN